MLDPDEQQLEIVLLQNSLQELANDVISQRRALPSLGAENDLRHQKTLNAVRELRFYIAALEDLNLENVKCSAKQLQIKRQKEDLTKCHESACATRYEKEQFLEQENQDIELEIRRYEDTLRELADRYRQNPANYDQKKMKNELEINAELNLKLQDEEKRHQLDVTELRNRLNNLNNFVPDNILEIIGQKELDIKLQSISSQCEEALRTKRDDLLKNNRQPYRYGRT